MDKKHLMSNKTRYILETEQPANQLRDKISVKPINHEQTELILPLSSKKLYCKLHPPVHHLMYHNV